MKLFDATSVARVFVYNETVHMGRQFDGLKKIIRDEMHKNPASGDLYFFVNKNKSYIKVLFYRNFGFLILAKRLDTSKFQVNMARRNLTIAEMQSIIDGVMPPQRLMGEAKANAMLAEKRRARATRGTTGEGAAI